MCTGTPENGGMAGHFPLRPCKRGSMEAEVPFHHGRRSRQILGVRRVFARISPNLPEKLFGQFLPTNFLPQWSWRPFLVWPPKKGLHVFFRETWVPLFDVKQHWALFLPGFSGILLRFSANQQNWGWACTSTSNTTAFHNSIIGNYVVYQDRLETNFIAAIRAPRKSRIWMLCEETSPKRWFANVNMTSCCDVTNSVYPVTMTTIHHCSTLEFGRGASNQAVAPGITRPLHATEYHVSAFHLLKLFSFPTTKIAWPRENTVILVIRFSLLLSLSFFFHCKFPQNLRFYKNWFWRFSSLLNKRWHLNLATDLARGCPNLLCLWTAFLSTHTALCQCHEVKNQPVRANRFAHFKVRVR